MSGVPPQNYGLKIAKPNKSANSGDRKDLGFDSAVATYLDCRDITLVVNSNPEIYVHGLNYVPKVQIWEILSDHNRKLPYDDGVNIRDFSVTSTQIKIRGVTSGTFRILIFNQNIF